MRMSNSSRVEENMRLMKTLDDAWNSQDRQRQESHWTAAKESFCAGYDRTDSLEI
jgi:hypothetical protein